MDKLSKLGKILQPRVYVVVMRRFGREESHAYVEGIYYSLAKAKKSGKAEQMNRDNKYEPDITQHYMDMPRNKHE